MGDEDELCRVTARFFDVLLSKVFLIDQLVTLVVGNLECDKVAFGGSVHPSFHWTRAG